MSVAMSVSMNLPQVTPVQAKREVPSKKFRMEIPKIDKKGGYIVEKNAAKVIKPRFAKTEKRIRTASKTKETPFVTQKAVKRVEEPKRTKKVNKQSFAKQMFVEATAYSSTVAQCDSSPFVTASGTRVHFGTIAANFLPFGTNFKIPELYGDTIFTVEDRMASWNRVDIWMPSYGEAISFGRRQIRIVLAK
jgi:3D (Asp-Asp-Asp) domain-containing protein